MAKEISSIQPTGQNLYAVILSPVGTIYDGSSLVTINGANWSSYARSLTESGSTGIYTADFPALAAGLYGVTVYQRLGGSPAATDTVVAAGQVPWVGTAVETPGVGGTVTLGATAPAGWINTAAFASGSLVPSNVLKVNGGDPVPADLNNVGLAPTGLDQISIVPQAGVPTTFRGLFVWVARRFYRSHKTPTALVVESDAGAALTTQAVSDDGQGSESISAPS